MLMLIGLMAIIGAAFILISLSESVFAADCINADCNGSGQIDIDDVVLYMSHLFSGAASPCEPCEDVLEVGKWYVVEDTSYSRSGLFAVGDSLFAFIDRWVIKDSIYIKSLTSFRGINVDAWMISDTAYRGHVDYYTEQADTIGVGITGGGGN
jgi:hypothetical protein